MQISDRIKLEQARTRIRVYAGDTLIADTGQALELHETGYPVRYYIPRHAINMDSLVRSETVTHCPFKGDATYYSLKADDNVLADAAWSYEQPFADMAMITNMVAFDPDRVDIRTS
ncbi:MAG: DUF427 domain-containing protein [Gammaproteobacteria bacterium]|nr:DUF427 domain-containing protein [Gammaproteobacteria bacterium]